MKIGVWLTSSMLAILTWTTQRRQAHTEIHTHTHTHWRALILDLEWTEHIWWDALPLTYSHKFVHMCRAVCVSVCVYVCMCVHTLAAAGLCVAVCTPQWQMPPGSSQMMETIANCSIKQSNLDNLIFSFVSHPLPPSPASPHPTTYISWPICSAAAGPNQNAKTGRESRRQMGYTYWKWQQSKKMLGWI